MVPKRPVVKRILVGVDPGKSGGIAIYHPNNSKVYLHAMKADSPKTLSKQMFQIIPRSGIIYVEWVGQGRPGNAIKAMTTFARHCGHLDAYLGLYGGWDNQNLVLPRTWMDGLEPDIFPPDERPKETNYRKRWIMSNVGAFGHPHISEVVGLLNLRTADAYGILLYAMKEEGYLTAKTQKGE